MYPSPGCSYADTAVYYNASVAAALIRNVAGNWVAPTSRVTTLALSLPPNLTSDWSAVEFPTSSVLPLLPLVHAPLLPNNAVQSRYHNLAFFVAT